MKKWWNRVALGGALGVVGVLGGCCQSDPGAYLGLYLFNPAATPWLDFAVSAPTLVFVSTSGAEEAMTYTSVEYFNQPSTDNCVETKCGTVCDSYDFATATTTLSSNQGTNRVVLELSKDFDHHTLAEPATQIGEFLQFQVNGTLTATLYSLPDTLLTQSVTLNGRSFSQVFSYEQPLALIQSGRPSAVYFNKSLGIVGFRIGENEIWRLK